MSAAPAKSEIFPLGGRRIFVAGHRGRVGGAPARRLARQPMSEASLLTGPLEPTNAWYAVAKIAGIKLSQAYRKQYGCDFISVMPTNLYGPGDNFDLASSHVVPALMRKIDAAKRAGAPNVEIWGSGTPRREFLYVDDVADACVHLLKHYNGADQINVGTGEDLT